MNKHVELDVPDPKLPRKRKLPAFYHSQSLNDGFYHDNPKTFHRHLYFETFDNIRKITRYMCIFKKS